VFTVGARSTGVHLTGTATQGLVKLAQISVGGEDSIGILDQTDNDAPEVFRCDFITLESNNTCGYKHNPSLSATVGVANIGSILATNGTTGTKGFEVLSGIVDAFIDDIDADEAIIVESGGTLNIVTTSVSGNINVDLGATLNCVISNYPSGTITNNGTINGIINGVRFGNWIVAVEELITPETDTRLVMSPDGSGMTQWVTRFGADYQYEKSEAESTTTSETFQNKVTLTTPSLPAGDYRLSWTAQITNDSGDKPVEVQITLDSNQIDFTFYAPKFEDEFFKVTGFCTETLLAGSSVLEMDFRATDEGGTAKIKGARLELFRVA